jgi:hypothetical protein
MAVLPQAVLQIEATVVQAAVDIMALAAQVVLEL